MCIVTVHPYEERTWRARTQPRQGVIHDRSRAALDTLVPVLALGAIVKISVVGVESSSKTSSDWILGINDERADKGGSVVSAMMQYIGQVGQVFSERLPHIRNVIELGIGSGKNVRVRGRGQWHLRVGA